MQTLEALLPVLFIVAFFLNIRASFKLGLDWRGMLTTVRFVRDAYARRSALPITIKSARFRSVEGDLVVPHEQALATHRRLWPVVSHITEG